MTAPRPATLSVLALRELRDAWRNRWFLLYAIAFAVLALALSWLSRAGSGGAGFAGLGRSAAGLVSLVMLVVPLMGLTLGAMAIAGERERGTLLDLLAQPVSRLEVVLGKFLGLSAAVLAALALGFGLAGVAIARSAAPGDGVAFLGFLGLAALLATAMVAVGLLVSALADRGASAAGVALFLWLALVLLGDLGLLGTALVMKLGARELLWIAAVHPLQELKLASLLALRGDLEVLGPAGLLAGQAWGTTAMPRLVAGLLLWTLVPLAAATAVVERRGGVG